MKTKAIYSVVVLFLSLGAFAHEMGAGPNSGAPGPEHMGPPHPPGPGVFVFPGVLNDRPDPKEGPCAELKLDAAQKAELKDLYFKFRESQVGLEAQAQKAHIAEEKVSADPNADFAAAESASATKHEAMGRLFQAMETYRNTVLYKVLKADQRPAARACLASEEHRFGGPGPHGPMGDEPEFHHRDDHKDKDAKKPQG